MNEKMSAWMDDELNRFEERALVERLNADAELRGRWERYHLAREALRHELADLAPAGFADRVAAALPPAATRHTRRLWRLAGTAAIAASVAVIALVGVQFLPGPSAPAGPLAQSPAAPAHAVSTRWQTRKPEQANNLNVYLVEHNEFSSSNSVGGMFPYVRIVSQGEDHRPK
jgi:sigma-E factor negative regulatory protein RseA